MKKFEKGDLLNFQNNDPLTDLAMIIESDDNKYSVIWLDSKFYQMKNLPYEPEDKLITDIFRGEI